MAQATGKIFYLLFLIVVLSPWISPPTGKYNSKPNDIRSSAKYCLIVIVNHYHCCFLKQEVCIVFLSICLRSLSVPASCYSSYCHFSLAAMEERSSRRSH